MDPLVALGDHGAHAEQLGALRRPIARRSGPVLATRDHDERGALGLVAHRCVVDEQLLAVGEVDGVRPLLARHEGVPQPDVRERAAHHHLVMAAPRAIRVELERADVPLLEPVARG